MGQTLFLRNLSFDTTEKDVVDRYDTLTLVNRSKC
jgi:hypothetical protein